MSELGLGLQANLAPQQYEEVARQVDASGLEVVSVFHDLGFQPALAPLLALARASERFRLGPMALNPFTLHPLEIAGQIAALDRASGGRAFLGLVRGAWLERLGLSQPRPLAALRDAVEIVRRWIAGEASGYVGPCFSLAPGLVREYEVERPAVPIALGTWGARGAALAGELGVAELKLGGCANPDMVRLARGRTAPAVAIVVGAVTVVDHDGRAARARAAAEVERYLPVIARHDVTLELPAGQAPPVERFVLAGTPAEVARHVERLWEAGASRVELGTPQGRDTLAGVRLICERVAPAII